MPNLGLRKIVAGTVLAVLGASTAAVSAAPADTLQATMQTQSQIDQAAARSQDNVDSIADQANRLLNEYLVTTQQVERLRVYNEQIEKLIYDQEETKRSILKQLEDVEVVEKEIIPLMLRMVDTLDQFVKLDIPFNLEERTNRVAELRDMMDSANVTVSEKYRRIMEAYMIETDFGRNIEAYRGTLDSVDGGSRTVDYLRVGRVLFAYQTIDKSEAGYWDQNTRGWVALDSDYRNAITEGIRVARKQAAPDLLELPVSAPESAQ